MIRVCVAGLFSLILLGGCEVGQEAIPVSLVGFNHTDTEIVFSINGSMSMYLSPHSGGGVACCANLYRPDAPGATVMVEWWEEGRSDDVQRRDVAIPSFDGGVGGFRTHFMRDGDIRVFVTSLFPGHADYPLQGDQALLYPFGESPQEKWAAARTGTLPEKVDAQINALRRVGATGGLPDKQLRPFIGEQISAAMEYGITDMDDQLDYLILALYTSGRFVEHPYVSERLSRRENNDAVPFREWAHTVPHAELETTGRPLWETVQN